MPVELCPAQEPGPGGNDASPQGTMVGGSKPLHRFMKGQPKIVGTIVLVLGMSFFIISIATSVDNQGRHTWTDLPHDLVMGLLFIICGSQYILTEHKPTKKTVTISLALSIITILIAALFMFTILPALGHLDVPVENVTATEDMPLPSYYLNVTLELIFFSYTLLATIIFIVMSSLAGAALRPTKSQAIVVMTTAPTETPIE